MSPHASVQRRRPVDVRGQVCCAPAFAARPLPHSLSLQRGPAAYVPQHAQHAAAKGPSAEELLVLPQAVAAIVAGPEPDRATTKASGAGTITRMLSANSAPTAGDVAPPVAGATLRQLSDTSCSERPAKRIRRSAGPQPRPLCWPPDAAAAKLLLQAACTPFDIGLEPALQHLAPTTEPQPLQMPASAQQRTSAPMLAEWAASGKVSSEQPGSDQAAQPAVTLPPLPAPPPLLPVFAHPCSRVPTPRQAAILRTCVEADAGRPSAVCQLAVPAVLAGYQEDWLEVAPTTLSMWQKVHFPSLKSHLRAITGSEACPGTCHVLAVTHFDAVQPIYNSLFNAG